MNHKRTFNTPHKTQSGFLMLDLLIGMVVILIVLSIWAKWQNTQYLENQARMVEQRLEHIIDKSQQYYMSRVIVDGNATTDTDNYPSDYIDLTDAGYIDECSDSEQADYKCVDYSDLPVGGGEEVDFNVTTDTDGWPVLELSFDISNEPSEKQKYLVQKTVGQIPGYTMNNEIITITVSRPGTALAYDSLVHTDGSVPMENNWDYGGVALENVSDIAFTDLTDRTAITGLLKNGSEYIDSSIGVTVAKPSCPSGYSATISTYFIGTGGDTQYAEVSNIDTWWESSSASNWTIHTRFIGRNIVDSNLSLIYQGNVGYFTWCDL